MIKTSGYTNKKLLLIVSSLCIATIAPNAHPNAYIKYLSQIDIEKESKDETIVNKIEENKSSDLIWEKVIKNQSTNGTNIEWEKIDSNRNNIKVDFDDIKNQNKIDIEGNLSNLSKGGIIF